MGAPRASSESARKISESASALLLAIFDSQYRRSEAGSEASFARTWRSMSRGPSGTVKSFRAPFQRPIARTSDAEYPSQAPSGERAISGVMEASESLV